MQREESRFVATALWAWSGLQLAKGRVRAKTAEVP